MEKEPLKEIVSVAEMARLCGLSRSRFYSLVKEGIMPQPSRREGTNRPCYTREQQAQCLLVRRTNCGVNGKAILFYAVRVDRAAGPRPASKSVARRARQPQPGERKPVDPILSDLRAGLTELGIVEVSDADLRNVLAGEYPDGYSGVPVATLLMTAFRSLNRPNSRDNVAG